MHKNFEKAPYPKLAKTRLRSQEFRCTVLITSVSQERGRKVMKTG
jgi:hypothetical protein